MKNNILSKLLLVIIVALLSSCTNRNTEIDSEAIILFDFENKIDSSLIVPQEAWYELKSNNGNTYLLVHNGFKIREAGVKLIEPKNNPWNFNGKYIVKADVSNVGDEFIQVEMFVGNDPNGLIRWFCSDYIDLFPGESGTITVPLSWTPWVHNPQFNTISMRGMPGKIKTNLDSINEITFCSRYADAFNSFTIDNVRIEGSVEERDTAGFIPFIDKYGQYIHRSWKGKIHSLEELVQSMDMENSDLAQHREPDYRSKYGGWTAGPRFEATGYFYPLKHKGKWWLVDPEGYLFWTSGLNCVRSGYGNTPITDREHYFKFLPDSTDSLKNFYSKQEWSPLGYYNDKAPYTAFSFYKANLYRKYGDSWHDEFRDRAHKRIRSWGMNTLGFMSDTNASAQHKTPYVGGIWIRETPKIEGSDGYWGKFHDVFDPAFREAVRISVEKQKFGANDPWCIGYFVDNELSWGFVRSLAIAALKSPATQPAKKEFIKDLKKKYKNIEQLNSYWLTDYSSWNNLLESTQAPIEKNAEEDLNDFYRKIAVTYFRTINEELKRVAPNQNYLGCRFAWKNNDVVIRSAAQYLDIISFNKYEYSVEHVGLPKGVDKPVMIGEFHFGSLDRGSLHPGVKQAKDQRHRGELYQSYIQGALRNPYIVGAHWFQYIDQAITGRADGENYNVGFVDICDNPYMEIIEKVRETNYGLYEYRLNH